MKYLIDTMVLSEPTKRKQDANVIHWFSLHRHECAVSILTLGEVERGITKMKDSNRKRRLMAWFNTNADGTERAGRILPVDRTLMSFWGLVHSREPRLTKRKPPFVDTLLAATAEMHGLTMVTRNEKDFPKRLPVINPWRSQAGTQNRDRRASFREDVLKALHGAKGKMMADYRHEAPSC